ncbi:unnamed protein product [Caenorhabditis auriculariae]|uniref:Uncharacterized protein n=1 Tax=Caenorhabditis auriculariae TaxID=2777116 RepID=A0A8S1HQW5_9PELO|nr:unnamed protein product [Caenorhabditis auriculariae]
MNGSMRAVLRRHPETVEARLLDVILWSCGNDPMALHVSNVHRIQNIIDNLPIVAYHNDFTDTELPEYELPLRVDLRGSTPRRHYVESRNNPYDTITFEVATQIYNGVELRYPNSPLLFTSKVQPMSIESLTVRLKTTPI